MSHSGECDDGRQEIIKSPDLTDVHGFDIPKEKKILVEYSHYFKDVSKYDYIDVYRVLELFSVTDPCIQHAVKKLLVAGGRGNKDTAKDVKEAIVSLQRWEAMRNEDSR